MVLLTSLLFRVTVVVITLGSGQGQGQVRGADVRDDDFWGRCSDGEREMDKYLGGQMCQIQTCSAPFRPDDVNSALPLSPH